MCRGWGQSPPHCNRLHGAQATNHLRTSTYNLVGYSSCGNSCGNDLGRGEGGGNHKDTVNVVIVLRLHL